MLTTRQYAQQLQKFAETTNTRVQLVQSSALTSQLTIRCKLGMQIEEHRPMIGQQHADLIILRGVTGFLLGGRGGKVLPNENCTLI